MYTWKVNLLVVFWLESGGERLKLRSEEPERMEELAWIILLEEFDSEWMNKMWCHSYCVFVAGLLQIVKSYTVWKQWGNCLNICKRETEDRKGGGKATSELLEEVGWRGASDTGGECFDELAYVFCEKKKGWVSLGKMRCVCVCVCRGCEGVVVGSWDNWCQMALIRDSYHWLHIRITWGVFKKYWYVDFMPGQLNHSL